jgi:hypothetical protein
MDRSKMSGRKLDHIIFDREKFKEWLETLNKKPGQMFYLDEEDNIINNYYGDNRVVVDAGFIINSVNILREDK